jgi:hypothetical protein
MEQMQDICRGSVGPLERTQGSATHPICYETLFFRYKKADHRYWKLINYSLT